MTNGERKTENDKPETGKAEHREEWGMGNDDQIKKAFSNWGSKALESQEFEMGKEHQELQT